MKIQEGHRQLHEPTKTRSPLVLSGRETTNAVERQAVGHPGTTHTTDGSRQGGPPSVSQCHSRAGAHAAQPPSPRGKQGLPIPQNKTRGCPGESTVTL